MPAKDCGDAELSTLGTTSLQLIRNRVLNKLTKLGPFESVIFAWLFGTFHELTLYVS